jgi:hypothetical protein
MIQKPFDRNYVIRTTVSHMRDAIDLSINKTFERLPEFNGSSKGLEVFETLAYLHKMRKDLTSYERSIPVIGDENERS